MTEEEFNELLTIIDEETLAKKKSLYRKYALANNTVKVGDVIQDHIGKIRVESIEIYKSDKLLECVYIGSILNANNTPTKRKEKKRPVWQSNLKKPQD